MNVGEGDYFLTAGVAELAGDEVKPVDRRYDLAYLKVMPADKSFGAANLFAGINIKTFEDYSLESGEDLSKQIIKQALDNVDNIVAFYLGDKAGLVLLHMLKTNGGSRINVPMINFQFLPLPGEQLRFIDKLRRMWSLDFEVVRFPEKPSGGRYSEEERAAEIDRVLSMSGARNIISSNTAFFEGGVCKRKGENYTEFRPLCGFSEEDISAYIKKHRLPMCSLDYDGTDEKEDKEVINKLRLLGYL